MQQKYNKQIAYWLIFGGLMVLLMVIIGGITRLTHSGLSIVTWQPIKGILPPMNEAEWQAAFEAYKKIPEYQKVHHFFTLSDYKKIFFWEYFHRILGRSLGIVFFIPFLYFFFTKKIQNSKLLKRLLLIFTLGGIQGLAGWYMVQSGLVENTSVDHFRLALHMSLALIILTSIFWTVFELLFPNKTGNYPKVRKFSGIVLGLLVIQIIYGGLTAGLKAGYVFPTYPKMGTKWFPDIASKMYVSEGISSFVNFPASVQFIHRWLGFAILLVVWLMLMKIRKNMSNKLLMNILWTIGFLITLQYTFGVLVILFKVPISLAVTHQVTAFVLFISLLFVYFLSKKRKSRFL